jgi:hypothetical protein
MTKLNLDGEQPAVCSDMPGFRFRQAVQPRLRDFQITEVPLLNRNVESETVKVKAKGKIDPLLN